MYPQSKNQSWRHFPAAIAAFNAVLLLPSLSAQTAPAAAPAPREVAPPPVLGKLAPPTDDDSLVVLSPFVVEASEDTGYLATSTLAGTRIRTDLSDVGSAISVVTEAFLRDTGARSSEDLLVLTTNTEVGSSRGNFSALNTADRDANESGLFTRANANTRVRGLGSADNTRDFFLTDIPWDSYNTGRVDLQRGPNSILFGLGNPSGIINSSTNPATFRNSGQIETRFGSYGSYRGSLDCNRVLLKDELALRVSGLFDRTEYQQRPAFNEDQRAYVAMRYDPAFLAKGRSHFSFRANFEAGTIDQSRPRDTPPIDRITPWFNTTPVTVEANPIAGTPERTFPAINRSVYDIYQAYRTYDPNIPYSGSVGSSLSTTVTLPNGTKINNPNYQPGISEIYTDGSASYWADPDYASQPGAARGANPVVPNIISESTRTMSFGLNSNGVIDRSVSGVPYARLIGLTEPWKLAQFYGKPFYGNYGSYSLKDPTIFDFYHKLIDGPNKPSTRSFKVVNIDVSETLLDNRIGLDLTYDRQNYNDRQDILYTDRYQAINVDINATLPDGSPNPNVGRPYIGARSNGGGSIYRTDRESFRFTAFGELRATDFMRKSLLSSILGRHVITGVLSTDDIDRDSRSFNRMLLDQGYPLTTQGTNTITSRSLQFYNYIGPDMRNITSPSGLDLSASNAFISPSYAEVAYFDSHWVPPINPTAAGYVDPSAAWLDPFSNTNRTQSENPANYGGWKIYKAQVLNSIGDGPDALTSSATLNRNKLTTKAINWQGYLWDDTLIPLFGYRRDTNRVYTTNAPVTAGGIALVNDPRYEYDAVPRARQTTEIRSYGGVLHLPRFLRGKLPLGTNVSLTYNKSSNFNPSDVGRVDMLNRALPPSQGDSKDYGFVISTLHDTLTLRTVWYKTSVSNQSFGWGAPQNWLFDDEARGWQQARRLKAGLELGPTDPRFATTDYNYYTMINNVATFTDADRARQKRDVDNYFANVPTDLFVAGGIASGVPPDSTWLVGAGAGNALFVAPNGLKPAGYTATRDSISKGVEFDLNYNPTKAWSIAANAARTEATTNNNVGNLVEWLDKRDAFWNGPAGEMLIYHNRTDDAQASNTIRADWNNNVGYPYLFQKYTNGANQQQMAKWRFNVTTNYNFTSGLLKGFKVGGSYRWVDKAAIGYYWTYLTVDNTTGKQIEAPDVSRPVYGKEDSSVDAWIGYSHKLGPKVTWEIQLNVRNVFGSNTIIPISCNPDGTYALYRIKEGPSWSLTNRFKF